MMKWIRDTHVYAYIVGFCEHIWAHSEMGLSHETDEDWNESYDSGWNLADDIRLFLRLQPVENYVLVWRTPAERTDLFMVTPAVSEPQAIRFGLRQRRGVPDHVCIDYNLVETIAHLKDLGFRP